MAQYDISCDISQALQVFHVVGLFVENLPYPTELGRNPQHPTFFEIVGKPFVQFVRPPTTIG